MSSWHTWPVRRIYPTESTLSSTVGRNKREIMQYQHFLITDMFFSHRGFRHKTQVMEDPINLNWKWRQHTSRRNFGADQLIMHQDEMWLPLPVTHKTERKTTVAAGSLNGWEFPEQNEAISTLKPIPGSHDMHQQSSLLVKQPQKTFSHCLVVLTPFLTIL